MTWVEATIAHVVQETPLDRSFVLALPDAAHADFAFVPGQYVVVRDPNETPARDWYFSLSAAPNDQGTVRVTVRARGDAVQHIYGASEGATWLIQPPAGGFHVEASAGERVVLAAAGSGVTPYRAFVEHHAELGDDTPVWLLHCARTSAELLFHAEFAAWSDERSVFTYVPTVTAEEAGWTGRRGRIDAALVAEAVGDAAVARLYACGPGPFVEAVHERGARAGLTPERLVREAW